MAALGTTTLRLQVDKIQYASSVTSYRRHVDKTVSVTTRSNFEISSQELQAIDQTYGKEAWTLIAPNEMNEADIPKEDVPSDNKKPSTRLRSTLYVFWDTMTDKAEPFEQYYNRQIEKIIGNIKERLPER